jgi:hypothetical protein
MNVLKPSLQAAIETLLSKGISQREIERKTGIDRKTIRRYARLCAEEADDSNSPASGEGAAGSPESRRFEPQGECGERGEISIYGDTIRTRSSTSLRSI